MTTKFNCLDQGEVGRGIGGVDGLGNTTRTYHDATGNVIRSVDANGNATEYQYDNRGLLWVTTDPNGGRVTQMYDANGNLETYTDPLGNTTTFVYNTQNREIERIDALGNSLTYAYDARNLMSSQTDRLGRRKDWTYDELGRVETETWINADTSTANVLTFMYDANGNQTLAEDDDGTYTLGYDNQDRLETIDGLFGVSLTFAYDALSRRTWVEDSFGGVMSSTYDAAGRLEKRQFGGTSMATLTYERDYADNGEMLAARRYSDLSSTNLIGSTTYGYDAAYRLTDIQHKDGSGTNIAAYTMTFDAGGRITEENRNGTSVTYTYDTRSQLTQAGSDGYSYDGNGNRTMSGYSTGGMNQLLNDGTFTYTYDLEGNVSTKSKGSGLETWFYDYDHNNRLLSVRKTSNGSIDTLTVTYAYDVFGNRVKENKWSSSPGLVTTKFVYLGQEVYLDLDNSNAVLMRYIQGDTDDEMLVRIDGGNVVAWFLADRLGSVRDIADDGGTVIDSITYDAYGKITAETNSANRGNYAAFGYVFDSDTGFAIMPAGRPLDVLTGRFGGTDQLWDKGGLSNFYGYTGNNPTNATDPSGLRPGPGPGPGPANPGFQGRWVSPWQAPGRGYNSNVRPQLPGPYSPGDGYIIFRTGGVHEQLPPFQRGPIPNQWMPVGPVFSPPPSIYLNPRALLDKSITRLDNEKEYEFYLRIRGSRLGPTLGRGVGPFIQGHLLGFNRTNGLRSIRRDAVLARNDQVVIELTRDINEAERANGLTRTDKIDEIIRLTDIEGRELRAGNIHEAREAQRRRIEHQVDILIEEAQGLRTWAAASNDPQWRGLWESQAAAREQQAINELRQEIQDPALHPALPLWNGPP